MLLGYLCGSGCHVGTSEFIEASIVLCWWGVGEGHHWVLVGVGGGAPLGAGGGGERAPLGAGGGGGHHWVLVGVGVGGGAPLGAGGGGERAPLGAGGGGGHHWVLVGVGMGGTVGFDVCTIAEKQLCWMHEARSYRTKRSINQAPSNFLPHLIRPLFHMLSYLGDTTHLCDRNRYDGPPHTQTHTHTHTLTNNMCLSLDSKELYISVNVACSQRSQSFSSSSEPWVFSIPSSTWQSRALNVWPPDWRAGKGARVQPGGATVPKALLECSSSSGSL